MARPFVYVNMAMTADGKITSAAREYPRFTSERDRSHMDRLRAEADALLMGAGTVRADDPLWHVRSAEMRAHRRALGKGAGPLRVLVTGSGRIDPSSRFFDADGGDDPGRVIATTEEAPDAAFAPRVGRVEVWRLGRAAVDVAVLVERLGDRGARRLLVEGGAELNWALLRADLVDELHVTLAPALLGGRTAPSPVGGEGFPMAQLRPLRLEEVRREGDELFCRWTVVR
jgi:2,5-diamino-6-(ribosylamino)-4(3H)-pyrimidinone 5'-phosphate reductase